MPNLNLFMGPIGIYSVPLIKNANMSLQHILEKSVFRLKHLKLKVYLHIIQFLYLHFLINNTFLN